jgi:hypothetical protein
MRESAHVFAVIFWIRDGLITKRTFTVRIGHFLTGGRENLAVITTLSQFDTVTLSVEMLLAA